MVYASAEKPAPLLSIIVAFLMSGMFLVIPYKAIVGEGVADLRLTVTYLCLSIGAWICAGFQKGFRSGAATRGVAGYLICLFVLSSISVALCFSLSGLLSGIALVAASLATFAVALPAGFRMNAFVIECATEIEGTESLRS